MAENTIPNRTIFVRDNLEVMRGMNSESIDLIYLDPPFNKGQQWSAPVGSKAAGAAFKDAWALDDVKEEWVDEIEEANPALHHTITAAGFTHGDSMQGYLTYMAIRLLEMRRLLKTTGSIYLHCDSTASHYLKTLMDAVFGSDNFRNEIIWHYGGRGAKAIAKQFARNHDILLLYSNLFGKHTFERQYLARQFTPEEARQAGFRQDEQGRWFKTSPRGDYTDESIQRLESEDRIYRTRTGSIRIKYFLKQNAGKVVEDVLVGDTWSDIPDAMHIGKERLGYPTQKPLALLERVIGASSNGDDVVLDPFCGCATTCVAAEKLGRQWVGIDLSEKAYDLVVQRLAKEVKVGSTERPTLTGWNVVKRTDIPVRTDAAAQRRSKNIRELLYGRQGGYCNGCGVHFPPRNLTLDHIVPRAKGGADADENLQLLCGACNSMKGSTRTQDELKAELRKRGLLH